MHFLYCSSVGSYPFYLFYFCVTSSKTTKVTWLCDNNRPQFLVFRCFFSGLKVPKQQQQSPVWNIQCVCQRVCWKGPTLSRSYLLEHFRCILVSVVQVYVRQQKLFQYFYTEIYTFEPNPSFRYRLRTSWLSRNISALNLTKMLHMHVVYDTWVSSIHWMKTVRSV